MRPVESFKSITEAVLAMQDQGLSKRETAERVGVPRDTVSVIRANGRKLNVAFHRDRTVEAVAEIAAANGMTTQEAIRRVVAGAKGRGLLTEFIIGGGTLWG